MLAHGVESTIAEGERCALEFVSGRSSIFEKSRTSLMTWTRSARVLIVSPHDSVSPFSPRLVLARATSTMPRMLFIDVDIFMTHCGKKHRLGRLAASNFFALRPQRAPFPITLGRTQRRVGRFQVTDSVKLPSPVGAPYIRTLSAVRAALGRAQLSRPATAPIRSRHLDRNADRQHGHYRFLCTAEGPAL